MRLSSMKRGAIMALWVDTYPTSQRRDVGHPAGEGRSRFRSGMTIDKGLARWREGEALGAIEAPRWDTYGAGFRGINAPAPSGS
jgi:hypothetical protein